MKESPKQPLTTIDTDELVLYALDTHGNQIHQLAPTRPGGIVRIYMFEHFPQINSELVPQI